MQVTRRCWASVGLAGLLAVAGIVLIQPLFIAGAAGLGAWLLVQQWLFVRSVRQLQDELQIVQTIARDRVVVDEPVTGGLTAELADESSLPAEVTIEAGIPLGATGADPEASRLTLAETTREATTTFTVKCSVASRVAFDAATVTVADEQGLFRTTFADASGTQPTVTVTPEHSRTLHVGAGGDPVKSVAGDHPTDQHGSGIEPATVREYDPGDAVRQIDWKATARSDTLYVRTFTEQIEHETAIIIDQRDGMGIGTPGETKLDYARQVALGVVDQAQTQNNAIGLYAVGNEGVTERQPPGATTSTYSALRASLHDLTPTVPANAGNSRESGRTATGETGVTTDQKASEAVGATPSDARENADALAGDDSAFTTSLRPYFATARTYVQRVATKPLYTTLRTYLTTAGETTRHFRPDRIVILTDDTNYAELRQAVKVARHHSDQVLVFLTPSVLFEPSGLADMETAYDRYVEFETFRGQLTQLDGVSAFEVAPGDRLTTLQTAAPTSGSSR